MLQQRPGYILFHLDAANATGRTMQWELVLIELPMYSLMINKYGDFSVTIEDWYRRLWYKYYLRG